MSTTTSGDIVMTTETAEVQSYLKSLTVLYVEDEEGTRELCSEFLSRLVGVLVAAPNGAEGLDAWRQHKPDIIITDIHMPVMDGLAMLQEIRSVHQTVPVIVLSAFEEPEYLKRSIDLGVSGYVVKPVNVSRFIEVLLNCARALRSDTALRFQELFSRSMFDGLCAHICVINATGVIISTNRSWDTYAAENNATVGACCVGHNYLAVLDISLITAVHDRADIEAFQAGLTAVLNGTQPHFVMEYDCPSPDDVRWFIVRVNPFFVDDKSYAVISHADITTRRQAETALKERNKELGCLYSIISLSNAPDLSFDELLKRAVMHIPPAWQFPDITEACIDIGGRSFQTAHFRETPWMLVNDIIAQDNKVGKVTVCYLEERTFLMAELVLLCAIAENLGLIVMRELAKETISRLAVIDELTGLNNRRFFNESLPRAISAARRHKQPLSLISIDIDHFKKVNDTFGHTMGDLVLKEFSRLLKMMVRVEDIACRWGGEEFIVLLPNTTCEGAVILADRMRSSFEQYPRTATPVVTASFGVARLQEGEDEDALMRRVDDALYQAKHEGRNRVVAACDVPLAGITEIDRKNFSEDCRMTGELL
jgi:diguanylate cyclase (GGDEF)-like protein